MDAGGSAFTGGGGVKIIDNMTGVLTSSGNVAPYGTYYVFGVTPVPITSPPPSAVSLSPPALNFSSNVGTPSPAQPVTVTNFRRAPLNLSGVSGSSGFNETDACPAQLIAGSSCTINVSFTPAVSGQRVADDHR